MEQIRQHIQSHEYDQAITLARSLGIAELDWIHQHHFLSYSPAATGSPSQGPGRRLTPRLAASILDEIGNKQWVAGACHQWIEGWCEQRAEGGGVIVKGFSTGDGEEDEWQLLSTLCRIGLDGTERTARALPQLEALVDGKIGDDDEGLDWDGVLELLRGSQVARGILGLRRSLLYYSRKLETWGAIHGFQLREYEGVKSVDASGVKAEEEGGEILVDEDPWANPEDANEDDPWAENASPIHPSKPDSLLPTSRLTNSVGVPPSRPSLASNLPVELSSFIHQTILRSALVFASSVPSAPCSRALSVLLSRHASEMWPWRFRLTQALPIWLDPTEEDEGETGAVIENLFPAVDFGKGKENVWGGGDRAEKSDWALSEKIGVALAEGGPATGSEDGKADHPPRDRPDPTVGTSQANPLSSSEITTFYLDRISTLTRTHGPISTALSLVQFAVSRGVEGLDEVGEEISLLERLVYGRPISSTGTVEEDEADWTLEKWRNSTPTEIISAFLRYSSAERVADDIRTLVLPYLSVLESREERNAELAVERSTMDGVGHTEQIDGPVGRRLLLSFALNLTSDSDAKLPVFTAIIQASSPTLPISQRIIKSNEDLARMAIAGAYAFHPRAVRSANKSQMSVQEVALKEVSKWMEGMPSFEGVQTAVSTSDAFKEAKATLSSALLSKTLTPVFVFSQLQPLAPQHLSALLDSLDFHLISSEMFARWGLVLPLSWFMHSQSDLKEQRRIAERLGRRGSGSEELEGTEERMESEDEWIALMEDMLSLTGAGSTSSGEEIEGPFGLIGRDDILKIFFGGLLSSGKFGLAKSLMSPSTAERPLTPQLEEELVIAASREFYDNAESGNLHKGTMKLAFECLSVGPQTPSVRKERDFIEATSRLTSFRIYSKPGVPISPIEIRLTSDKLSLISRLLSSNEDAYRHPEVILGLVGKLGYRGDALAEVKTLAMIADAGLQAGDWKTADEVCTRLVKSVDTLRKSRAGLSEDEMARRIEEASEVAWRSCFQLGKMEEWRDREKRMKLLGHALILCPGNRMGEILTTWRQIETEIQSGHLALPSPDANGAHSPISPSFFNTTFSPSPSFKSLGLPSTTSTAADLAVDRAARTLNLAASFLPFRGMAGPSSSAEGRASSRSRPTTPSSTSAPSRERSSQQQGFALDSSPKERASPLRGSEFEKLAAGEKDGGLTSTLSNRFTAGVGWLIGADSEEL